MPRRLAIPAARLAGGLGAIQCAIWYATAFSGGEGDQASQPCEK